MTSATQADLNRWGAEGCVWCVHPRRQHIEGRGCINCECHAFEGTPSTSTPSPGLPERAERRSVPVREAWAARSNAERLKRARAETGNPDYPYPDVWSALDSVVDAVTAAIVDRDRLIRGTS